MKQRKTPNWKPFSVRSTLVLSSFEKKMTSKGLPASLPSSVFSPSLCVCMCVFRSYNGWSPELLCGCLVTIPTSLPVFLRLKDPFPSLLPVPIVCWEACSAPCQSSALRYHVSISVATDGVTPKDHGPISHLETCSSLHPVHPTTICSQCIISLKIICWL